PLECRAGDVTSVLLALEVDLPDRGVGPRVGFGEVGAEAGDGKDTPSGGAQRTVSASRAGMKDAHAVDRTGSLHAADRISGARRERVAGGREDDAQRRSVAHERRRAEVARRRL